MTNPLDTLLNHTPPSGYRPARVGQVRFLCVLLVLEGTATDEDAVVYSQNLWRMSAVGDPHASEAYVGELIDHVLDRMAAFCDSGS